MFNLRLLQDLQLENSQLRQEYYTRFMEGNYSQAFQIIVNNPQLSSQVLKKENLNALVDGILALENYYKNGVTDYLQNEIARLQINIDELVYMNQFDPLIKYEINNFVLFNGEMYYCYKNAQIGTLPSDPNYWIYLGLKGDKGSDSLGVKYVGEWIPTTAYLKNDMVVYDGNLYVSKLNNTNKIPKNYPTEWFLAVKFIPQVIYISLAPDPSWGVGTIWIKLLN